MDGNAMKFAWKIRIGAISAVACGVVLACAGLVAAQPQSSQLPAAQPPTAAPPAASPGEATFEQQCSYAMGHNIGRSLLRDGVPIDIPALTAGLADVLSGSPSKMSDAQITAALQQLQQEMQRRAQAAAIKNKQRGEAFLAENAKKQGVQTTASGLQYRVIKPGSGETPTPRDTVRCNYEGRLIDGTVFDASANYGGPSEFAVGRVITNPSDTGIGIHHKIPVNTDPAFAFELRFRRGRRVRRSQCDEEKEWFLFLGVRLDVSASFPAKGWKHFGIHKIFSGGSHAIECAPSFLSSDVSLPCFAADECVGKHIERTGEKKAVIKTVVAHADLNRLGKVRILRTLHLSVPGGHARSQMPFPDIASRVASRLKHLPEGVLRSRKAQPDKSPGATLLRFSKSKRIAPRHNRGATGNANRIGDVCVGEFHSLRTELIKMRRINVTQLPAKRFDIPVSKIICKDENDVGAILCNGAQNAGRKDRRQRKKILSHL